MAMGLEAYYYYGGFEALRHTPYFHRIAVFLIITRDMHIPFPLAGSSEKWRDSIYINQKYSSRDIFTFTDLGSNIAISLSKGQFVDTLTPKRELLL